MTTATQHITQAHLAEWVEDSGVSETIAGLNLKSADNPVEIARFLNWSKYHGSPGWYFRSFDPLTGKLTDKGQFKSDTKIQFPDSDKAQNYFSFPKGSDSEIICLLLALSDWTKISEQVGVLITEKDVDKSRDDLGFWRWVLNHPEIPLLITEGGKKSACLLSHGRVAIALTGVWNGQQNKKLHPSLVPFVVPGREVYLVFDADIVVKKSVQDALKVLARLIHKAKAIVRIVTWDLKLGKGCDDFIVAHGPGEFDQVMNDATPYIQWLKGLEEQFKAPETPKTSKVPAADIVGREIIEDYRDRLLWNDEHKTWMHYGLERQGVWMPVSEGYLESVIDKILESKDITGYGSASYVTNIAAKMRRQLFERVWGERPVSEILPFTDGVLDLTAGQFHKHAPGHRLTWCLPRPYNVVATGWAKIKGWFGEATGGNAQDEETLIHFTAAVLRGRCDLHKFLHLIGIGGSGKSTFTRLLEALIGSQNCWNGSLQDLEDKHSVADLLGKRLVILPDQDKITTGLSNFKRLTGQDSLRGRRLYKDGLNFRFPGMAVVTSNIPIFHAGGGSWLTRRILMLAFNHKPATNKVRDLEAEFEPELSAFTSHLLSIPNDEITRVLRGAGSLDEVNPTLWQANIRTDSIAAWVNEQVIYSPIAKTQIGCDRNEWATERYDPSTSTLFGSYSYYCRISGLQAKGKNNFSSDLIELCQQTLVWDVDYGRDKQGRVIRGLQLRTNHDTTPTLDDALTADNIGVNLDVNPGVNLGVNVEPSQGKGYVNVDNLLPLKLCESENNLEENQRTKPVEIDVSDNLSVKNTETSTQQLLQVVQEVDTNVVSEVVNAIAPTETQQLAAIDFSLQGPDWVREAAKQFDLDHPDLNESEPATQDSTSLYGGTSTAESCGLKAGDPIYVRYRYDQAEYRGVIIATGKEKKLHIHLDTGLYLGFDQVDILPMPSAADTATSLEPTTEEPSLKVGDRVAGAHRIKNDYYWSGIVVNSLDGQQVAVEWKEGRKIPRGVFQTLASDLRRLD